MVSQVCRSVDISEMNRGKLEPHLIHQFPCRMIQSLGQAVCGITDS